jgi:DNA-binding NarL/FixJ family response regulator
MQHVSVVIAQKEQAASDRLSIEFKRHYRNIAVAHSHVEIHDAIANAGAHAVIVDLELIGFEQLRRLCQNSLGATVVATHRSPDDEMWKECLTIGAADCCHVNDIDGMLRAIAHSGRFAYAHAA